MILGRVDHGYRIYKVSDTTGERQIRNNTYGLSVPAATGGRKARVHQVQLSDELGCQSGTMEGPLRRRWTRSMAVRQSW